MFARTSRGDVLGSMANRPQTIARSPVTLLASGSERSIDAQTRTNKRNKRIRITHVLIQNTGALTGAFVYLTLNKLSVLYICNLSLIHESKRTAMRSVTKGELGAGSELGSTQVRSY